MMVMMMMAVVVVVVVVVVGQLWWRRQSCQMCATEQMGEIVLTLPAADFEFFCLPWTP